METIQKQKYQTDPTLMPPTSQEALTTAVDSMATALHENWRKDRLQEDGSFEPRPKDTVDQAWIDLHGTNSVDIANTDYSDLPSDWQAENKAAAEVIVGLIDEYNGIDNIELDDPVVLADVGSHIHDAWLQRNGWAAGGNLDVPFHELPQSQQDKDTVQMVVAQRVFSTGQ